MNRESRYQWINEILNEVFLAVIASETLRNALVFKGARILNLYLGDSRQSLDIDSNLTPELVASTPDRGAQASFLEGELSPALRRHFERQNPVKFKLGTVKVVRQPPKGHSRGWDAFLLRIEIQDNRQVGVRSLPAAEIDVAAPETLGPGAVQILNVQGIPARVYALHRIAGEKLRAYLTSLPAYRRKMQGGERALRVKDLHDLAQILRARSAADAEFWTTAGDEFQLACQSRLVDCRGLESFMENWPLARKRYETDKSLEKVTFNDAEQALKIVMSLFEAQRVFPLEFPAA